VGEITHPGRPWEIHGNLGGALAYFWVAQAFIGMRQVSELVVVKSLLAGYPSSFIAAH